uniref:Immunoglobulin V-set domain-containing protein n=1 Tax=Callorhinchus milii TaxID=7868 RepID=A0A4W3H2P5_CALMI
MPTTTSATLPLPHPSGSPSPTHSSPRDVSRNDVHWYRQLPGQQREWILTHDTNGRKTDHEDVNQRLQPSRVTSNNTYILILRRVTVSDAAVYHCCVWGDVCGNGTRLNVTCE